MTLVLDLVGVGLGIENISSTGFIKNILKCFNNIQITLNNFNLVRLSKLLLEVRFLIKSIIIIIIHLE